MAAALENTLEGRVVALAMQNPGWSDIHLACAVGLRGYVEAACRRGDPLS